MQPGAVGSNETPEVDVERRGEPSAGFGNVFCLLDAQARLIYASPALQQLFGVSGIDVTKHDPLQPVHVDDVELIRSTWTKVLAAPGAQAEADIRLVRSDGSSRVFEVVGTNLLSEPRIGAVMYSFRDVSERRAAQELLAESEARFRAILEHTTDGLVLVDDQDRITWASPAVHDIVGYRPDEVVGSIVLDYVHPHDRGGAVAQLERWLSTGTLGSPLAVRTRHADGGWRWTEVLAKSAETLDEHALVMLSLRDVTARVEAEQAARQSELRFRTVMDNSYDVVAVLAADGVVKWITPNCARLVGWSAAEIEGRNGLEFIHPDDLEHMMSELAAFSGGDGIPNPTPVKVAHKDGRWRHVETVGTDFLENPDVEGIAVSLRNVDERVSLERDRQRLTEIFELTSDLVLTADNDGLPVYLNSAAKHFFGVDEITDLSSIDMARWVGAATRRRLEVDVFEALGRGLVWGGEFDMLRADGRLIPVMAQIVGHRDAEGALEFVSMVARDISERKAFETRLAHDATHDPLTGLPNRTMLIDRLGAALSRARRHDTGVGVLFCDLDNFKIVNDSLGHSQGDRLLTLVAERLRDQLRPEDTVGRFGGDEFVILCEDVSDAEGAVAVAKRVEHAFSRPFSLDEHELFVGVSVGVVATSGDAEGVDPESLIRDADAAMYGAKLGGRNRFQLFEPGMWERAVGRFDIENALRGALARREFELHYQPIFDLADRRVVAVEALVRWNHAERGQLPPGDFVPLAEDTGLIVPIGTWVLETACRQLQAWRAGHPELADLAMAVNISGRQLEHPDFVEQVATVLDRTGTPPDSVHLEVTESALMDDVDQSQLVLVRLKTLGVHLAVDDFGTGYSSLSRLKRFPVDSLKVDRSFVDGLGAEAEDSAIVAAIVNLAHTLGLVAVAEGVETEAQVEALRQLHCDQLQGYLLARPLAPDDLLASVLGLQTAS